MKLLGLRKLKVAAIQIKSADISQLPAVKQTCVSSSTVGSFLVLVRNEKPRQRRLPEQLTKKVTTACWNASNMKSPKIRLTV